MIQKGAIKKAIEEGKPSVNIQKLESEIMKVQADVEIIRKFLRDYEQLQQVILMERGEQVTQEDYPNLTSLNGHPLKMNDISRWKSNLVANIYGAMEKLRNTQLAGNDLNELFNNFCNFNNGYGFNTNMLNEEILDNINIAIEKHEKEPFLRWNYNLKTPLRYNFAEDSKRTWNKIKMTASLPSDIKPEQFANHYCGNWSNFPRKKNIEEYNEFTKHMNNRQRLNLSKFEANILHYLMKKIKRSLKTGDQSH
jgi:hypothetical protein